MRLRTSFFFNIAIVGVIAAMLTIPGEAKQPDPAVKVAPQSSFGLFLDPHVEPVLIIELARNLRGPLTMRTRIGAALMIVVAAFLMMGIETSGLTGTPGFTVDYTMALADGSLIPLVVD